MSLTLERFTLDLLAERTGGHLALFATYRIEDEYLQGGQRRTSGAPIRELAGEWICGRGPFGYWEWEIQPLYRADDGPLMAASIGTYDRPTGLLRHSTSRGLTHMDTMDLARFAHLFGVVLIAAAQGIEWTALRLIRRAKTSEDLRRFASVGKGLEIAFPVSVLLILISGIYIVERYDAWGRAWVVATLAAFILMSVLGGAIASRRLKAIEKAAESSEPGPISPSLAAKTADPLLWTTELVLASLIVAIVLLKVVKPEAAGAVAIVALSVLVAFAWALVSLRVQAPAVVESATLETTGTT
jgi:hypothetical protein